MDSARRILKMLACVYRSEWRSRGTVLRLSSLWGRIGCTLRKISPWMIIESMILIGNDLIFIFYKHYTMLYKSKFTVSETSLKKKIKDYNVSYCKNEFITKNLYGEIRLGYKNENKKVYAFRISPLPLSAYTKSIFGLQ